MATSAIAITDLVAVGAANQINLQWGVSDPHVGGLPYLQFDHAEVRYADDEAMTSPTTLTTAATFSYNHLQVLPGAAYYYQVRAVDKSGQFGEWCDPVLGEEAAIDSSAISTEWDDFTPTVAAASGLLTTVTLGTCRYKQVGLLVLFTVEFEIVDVGTGADYILVSGIPNEAAQGGCASAYYESAGVNIAMSAALFPSTPNTRVDLFNYDGADPIAAARTYVVSGQFEIAV